MIAQMNSKLPFSLIIRDASRDNMLRVEVVNNNNNECAILEIHDGCLHVRTLKYEKRQENCKLSGGVLIEHLKKNPLVN